ncbi:ATP-binding protein [Gordonia sp. LSe1-13]|uniref:ATP-binding protein n=1 Tax=Gordonia sesuvii TaxID=3116777 RepID=A0ABU7ME15_9ACTN|nr:ATP-binding protein [Gordonia sp. LSe1-13]
MTRTLDTTTATASRPPDGTLARDGGWRAALAGPPDASGLVRVQRIVARFIAVGLLVITAVLTPVIIDRADLTAAWWPPLSVLLVAGPAVAVAISTYRPGLNRLTEFGILSCVSVNVAVLLWFVASNGAVAPDGSRWAIWMIQFIGVPGLLLSMSGHHRWAFFHVLGSTLLAYTANQFGLYGGFNWESYLNALLTVALICVFLSITVVTRRTAEVLDDEEEAAIRGAAASAASSAQEEVRARFAGLIHDKVMAILLTIRPGRQEPSVTAQAVSALDELDTRAAGSSLPAEIGADDFAHHVRAAVEFIDDDLTCSIRSAADTETVYPAAVATSMIDAMNEAVRNWRRHGGVGSSCAVTCDLRDHCVSITVVDDGRGFDPLDVAPERLGLATGIDRRMAVLPGGRSTVTSSPGRGTTVHVEWVRDAAE